MSVFTVYPLVLAINMHKENDASTNKSTCHNSTNNNGSRSNSCNISESRTKCRNADVNIAEEDVISSNSNSSTNSNTNTFNNNNRRREQSLRHMGYCYTDTG